MAISDNTRFAKLRRPVVEISTPTSCGESHRKIMLRLKIRPKIMLRLPGLAKIEAERSLRIKAEQDEEKLTPEQESAEREEIEQRIKQLVLEAEADKSGPVMKIEYSDG